MPPWSTEMSMAHARSGLIAFAALSLAIVACGGKTSVDGGGAGGTGTGASPGGGAPSGGGVGAVSGGGGMGGAPMGGTSACGPVDPGGPCGTLGETGCLAASPRCAPVYDDHCCPDCEPMGACADCVDYRFFECIPFEESNCTPGLTPHCGVTPQWACQGGSANCVGDGPCNMTPGCIDAVIAGCGPDALCESECHPTTAWTCGPDCAQGGPMPFCADGVPELGPEGYTGYCVRAGVCGGEVPPDPGACPVKAPAHGSACASPGLSCQYTGFCAPTCKCEGGKWACLTPPC